MKASTSGDQNANLGDSDSLKHELLLARDRIIGLEAENATLTKQLRMMESTEIGKLYERVDSLEDQKEVLIDEMHKVIISQRIEAAKIKSSTTWRAGRLIIRPLAKITGRPTE